MRFFIEISYFGKNFHGWQIQENAISVQEEIDNALSLILKQKIKTLGSGRTDSGVHALSQVAHFDYDRPVDKSFLYKVNSFLSNDISVNSIKQVRENASARFDAITREYIYKIHSIKSPFKNNRSLFYPKKINLKLINKACHILLEHKDFKTFSKVKTDVNNYICAINKSQFKISNHFLIMAGGFGKRLLPLTKKYPKPMLKIGNIRIIDRIIQNAKNYGFEKFIISTH